MTWDPYRIDLTWQECWLAKSKEINILPSTDIRTFSMTAAGPPPAPSVRRSRRARASAASTVLLVATLLNASNDIAAAVQSSQRTRNPRRRRAQTVAQCPPVTASTSPQRALLTTTHLVLDPSTATATASLTLPLTSSSIRSGADEDLHLCTLTRLVGKVHVPIARSYDGRTWELTAGRYLPTTTLSCDDNDGTDGECTVSGLPNVGEDVDDGGAGADGGGYYLTSYHRPLGGNASESGRNGAAEIHAARFLERTTFGPTRDEVSALSSALTALSGGTGVAANDDAVREGLAAYTHNQIYSTPTSSHREYYRRHLVPRTTSTYPYALAGPHPCSPRSRWRRFVFTTKDVELSRFSSALGNGDAPFGWDSNPFYKVRFVEWTSPSDGGSYVLVKYGKWIRTVLAEMPTGVLMDTDNPSDKYARFPVELEMDVDYTLCDVMEFVGSDMPTGPGYTSGVEWSLFMVKSSCILGNECTAMCEDLNERIMVVGGNFEVNMHPDLVPAGDAGSGVQVVDMSGVGGGDVVAIREGGVEVLYIGDGGALDTAVCDAILDPAAVCFW